MFFEKFYWGGGGGVKDNYLDFIKLRIIRKNNLLWKAKDDVDGSLV